jgi:hypothetical protein
MPKQFQINIHHLYQYSTLIRILDRTTHVTTNSLAIPAPIRTLLSTSIVSSVRIIFGGGYENCPEFDVTIYPRNDHSLPWVDTGTSINIIH